MFYLGVLLAEVAVLIGLCLFTDDYAAFRLGRDRVLLIGCGSVLLVHSVDLWQDMKEHHCLSGLMTEEQYGRLCRTTQASSRGGRLVDYIRF